MIKNLLLTFSILCSLAFAQLVGSSARLISDPESEIADERSFVADETYFSENPKQCNAFALQKQMDAMMKTGGGTIYIEPGIYTFSNTITIPKGVALRGKWRNPGNPDKNITWFYIYKSSKTLKDSFAVLEDNSCIRGISVYYPEQNPKAPIPFASTFQIYTGSPATLERLTIVNPVVAIAFGPHTAANGFGCVSDVYASPLEIGLWLSRCAAIPRFRNLNFMPDYWVNFEKNITMKSDIKKRLYEKSKGIILARADGGFLSHAVIRGLSTGIEFFAEENKAAAVRFYNIDISNCHTGIYMNNTKPGGNLFFRSRISANETALYAVSNQNGGIEFHETFFKGKKYSFFSADKQGKSTIHNFAFNKCTFEGDLYIGKGYTTFNECNFENKKGKIKIGEKGTGILTDYYLSKNTILANDSKFFVIGNKLTTQKTIGFQSLNLKTPEITGFSKTGNSHIFSKKDLFTKNFGTLLQQAIDNMKDKGGVVYIPSGVFHLDKNIVVHENVTVAGAIDWRHKFGNKGTFIIIEKNESTLGEPLFILKSGATLRGMTCFYSEQSYFQAKVEPYPALIQGQGANISVRYFYAPNAYYVMDLDSYRCDNAFIEFCDYFALDKGIVVGGNSENIYLKDIHVKHDNWTSKFPDDFKHVAVTSFDGGSSENTAAALSRPFIISDCKNLIIENTFTHAAHQWTHFITTRNGGGAENAYMLNHNSEALQHGIKIEKVSGTFHMVNTDYIVNRQGPQRNFLEIGPAVTATLVFDGISIGGIGGDNRVKIEGGKVIFNGGVFNRRDPHLVEISNAEVSFLGMTTEGPVNILSDEKSLVTISGLSSPRFNLKGVAKSKLGVNHIVNDNFYYQRVTSNEIAINSLSKNFNKTHNVKKVHLREGSDAFQSFFGTYSLFSASEEKFEPIPILFSQTIFKKGEEQTALLNFKIHQSKKATVAVMGLPRDSTEPVELARFETTGNDNPLFAKCVIENVQKFEEDRFFIKLISGDEMALQFIELFTYSDNTARFEGLILN